VVRGEARGDSDIDILVEVGSGMSLLDFVGLKLEIEEALGRRVDLVEYSTIKPLLKERILGE
jgi:predicted nucleotidyltransferase